jgi:hypothetical protein
MLDRRPGRRGIGGAGHDQDSGCDCGDDFHASPLSVTPDLIRGLPFLPQQQKKRRMPGMTAG